MPLRAPAVGTRDGQAIPRRAPRRCPRAGASAAPRAGTWPGAAHRQQQRVRVGVHRSARIPAPAIRPISPRRVKRWCSPINSECLLPKAYRRAGVRTASKPPGAITHRENSRAERLSSPGWQMGEYVPAGDDQVECAFPANGKLVISPTAPCVPPPSRVRNVSRAN